MHYLKCKIIQGHRKTRNPMLLYLETLSKGWRSSGTWTAYNRCLGYNLVPAKGVISLAGKVTTVLLKSNGSWIQDMIPFGHNPPGINHPEHNPQDEILLLTLWQLHTKHYQSCMKAFTAGERLPAYSYYFALRLIVTALIRPIKVTCGLTTEKPGLAACPTLVIEYGTTFDCVHCRRGKIIGWLGTWRNSTILIWSTSTWKRCGRQTYISIISEC